MLGRQYQLDILESPYVFNIAGQLDRLPLPQCEPLHVQFAVGQQWPYTCIPFCSLVHRSFPPLRSINVKHRGRCDCCFAGGRVRKSYGPNSLASNFRTSADGTAQGPSWYRLMPTRSRSTISSAVFMPMASGSMMMAPFTSLMP